MTRSEVAELIASFGLDWTYYQFPNNEAPLLPYVVYYYPERTDVVADNENFCKKAALRIELYTETKDFDQEDRVEELLPFPYTKETVFIEDENMYQTIYETEVIINAEQNPLWHN